MATFSESVKLWKRSENKILSPRVLNWLHDNSSFTVPPEHESELIRITTDSSNSVRHGRFGASSRGDCYRQQVFKFLGVDGIGHSDPVLSNIFLDGTWRHVRWQMMGLANGWFTDVEVRRSLPELRLVVSADALNTDEGWGFELKGTSQLSSIIRNGVPEKHLLQIHTMMMVFDIDTWVYMAEDKSRQEIHEVVIYRDDQLAQSVKDEISELNSSIESRELPEVLPACKGSDGRLFRGCPFRDVCIDFNPETVPAERWVDIKGVANRA